MTKIKYILVIFLTYISVLMGTEWTILIYMAADNGLHEYALADLAEMELSLFSQEANIIVQMDGDSNSDLPGTYRYKISPNPEAGIQSTVLANLGEMDSGSYQTLKSFVEWGFDRYKSDRRALIIWSHGNGWSKQELCGKGIAPDNSSENFISMSEHQMQVALSNVELDILIYDACNMQTIENLVELKGRADYVIGSEATVPSTGLPYAQIFDYWSEATNLDSLVVNIPKIYVDSYRPGNLYNPGPYLRQVTYSTAKMEYLDGFESALNEYLNKWSDYPEEFQEARKEINEFGLSFTDVDLKELLEYLGENSDNQDLVNDSNSLGQKLEEVFISYDSSSYNYKVGPASFWFPRYSYQFTNNWPVYRNLNFAQGRIGKFINKFLGPDLIPPFPFEITKSLVLNETIFIEWENHNDPDPLTYYLNFEYSDNSNQVITLYDEGGYEGVVKLSGEFYLVAEDASENRVISERVTFNLPENYGELYLAPNPIRNMEDGQIIIYDREIGGKEAEFSIFSISGARIGNRRIKLPAGLNEHKIKLNEVTGAQLSSGVYICMVKIGNKQYKTKFAIEY
ncbi:T9SS type A sorting domain-containing protein [bacterium]|nr:T9SS type A sorting domain-containing protein [bacterium]